ncbi:hypothetical protein G7046_g4012 [Stylonectria norvegica]|nr:hypothetical protein G7046_g4012 [Stylonectria norvegica]
MPPQSSRTVTVDTSSAYRYSKLREAAYFTVMMVSKGLPLLGGFRVPLITNMGRDVLSVDIRVSGQGKTGRGQKCIRLCTTHLESLTEGKAHRLGQLAKISDLLQNPTVPGRELVGGVVGGDMNAIEESEHSYHLTDEVRLQDIWLEASGILGPELDVSKRAERYDEETGNTWNDTYGRGHRSQRLDKFLYSGSIETLPVRDAYRGAEASSKFEIFGIGLTTEVEVWELRMPQASTGGRAVEEGNAEYVSEERYDDLKSLGFLGSYRARRTKINARVSDHHGITARIRVN